LPFEKDSWDQNWDTSDEHMFLLGKCFPNCPSQMTLFPNGMLSREAQSLSSTLRPVCGLSRRVASLPLSGSHLVQQVPRWPSTFENTFVIWEGHLGTVFPSIDNRPNVPFFEEQCKERPTQDIWPVFNRSSASCQLSFPICTCALICPFEFTKLVPFGLRTFGNMFGHFR
jgi:hypothetical protein